MSSISLCHQIKCDGFTSNVGCFKPSGPLLLFLFLSFMVDFAKCWDPNELEVFDVVEEVNQNFYTLLDVSQDADHGQIKKAFRRLSLVLHPDKNDAPDAEVKFRQLVAVYDIVKDPDKRRCYDNVLENGLPDWKQAVYYYRRVRKMGLAEMLIILFIIISIGQYLVGWAQYLEQKLTIDDFINSKAKKLLKKQRKGNKSSDSSNGNSAANYLLPPELDLEQHKPSVFNTLPFQISRLVWFLIVSAPPLSYRFIRDYWHERQQKQAQEEETINEESEQEEINVVHQPRGPRRRKQAGFKVPELSTVDSQGQEGSSAKSHTNASYEQPQQPVIVSGGFWTDDDLALLVRLVKKYPAGTVERWEKIGMAMKRPAAEVAHMAHKVKDDMVNILNRNFNKLNNKIKKRRKNSDEETTENLENDSNYDDDNSVSDLEDEDDYQLEQVEPAIFIEDQPKKVKTKGGKLGAKISEGISSNASALDTNWSQIQQKALESALAKYPKSISVDRWEKIAKCVPNKTKEECMLRYKQLVEMVKKKKEDQESQSNDHSNNSCDSSSDNKVIDTTNNSKQSCSQNNIKCTTSKKSDSNGKSPHKAIAE